MAGFFIGQQGMQQEMQRESDQSADDQHQRNMEESPRRGSSMPSSSATPMSFEAYKKYEESRPRATPKPSATATPSITHRLMNYFHEDDGK